MKIDRRTFREIGDPENEVNVETTATLQLDNGTVITATSAVHRRVSRHDRARIKEIQESQQKSLVRTFRALGHDAPRMTRRIAEIDRETLLKGTCPGTGDVFDLIDDLAGRPIRWVSDSAAGVRCTAHGTPPEMQRVHGRYKLEWGPGALCPLAAATAVHGGVHEAGDEDVRQETNRDQLDPMAAARRRYAETRGLETPPDQFTIESAAWAMLVLASDRKHLTDWLDEQETGIADADRDYRMLTRTLDAITTWLEQTLKPERPRRTVVEPPQTTTV